MLLSLTNGQFYQDGEDWELLVFYGCFSSFFYVVRVMGDGISSSFRY